MAGIANNTDGQLAGCGMHQLVQTLPVVALRAFAATRLRMPVMSVRPRAPFARRT